MTGSGPGSRNTTDNIERHHALTDPTSTEYEGWVLMMGAEAQLKLPFALGMENIPYQAYKQLNTIGYRFDLSM